MDRSTRSWIVIIGAAVVVIAAVVAAIVFVNSQPAPSTTPLPGASETSASASPGESASPTPSPSAAGEEPATDAPVPIGEEATADDGVTAVVTGVTPFTAEGGGIGEVGGDAVRVDVTLTNTGEAEQSLGAVTVNLEYGPEATPGSPMFYDPSVEEFSGMLGPGESRSGSYVFAVPEGEQGSLTITVNHTPASPPFVFTK